MLTRLAVRRPLSPEAEYLAFCIIEQPDGPPAWVRCGHARQNGDGSVNVRLDALPLSGELHLRPAERRASPVNDRAPQPPVEPGAASTVPLHS